MFSTFTQRHFLYFPHHPFIDDLGATHRISFIDDGSDTVTVELMEWKGGTWVDAPLGNLKTADPKGWEVMEKIRSGTAHSHFSENRFYRPRGRQLWLSLMDVGWKWKEGT